MELPGALVTGEATGSYDGAVEGWREFRIGAMGPWQPRVVTHHTGIDSGVGLTLTGTQSEVTSCKFVGHWLLNLSSCAFDLGPRFAHAHVPIVWPPPQVQSPGLSFFDFSGTSFNLLFVG